MNEAYVPDWVEAARQKRFGMSIVSWRFSRTGDVITFQFDADPVQDHTGLILARPSLVSGIAHTIEGNTSSSDYGSQADGGGLWRRTRDARPPQILIRIS
jgi:hypothetical protein